MAEGQRGKERDDPQDKFSIFRVDAASQSGGKTKIGGPLLLESSKGGGRKKERIKRGTKILQTYWTTRKAEKGRL